MVWATWIKPHILKSTGQIIESKHQPYVVSTLPYEATKFGLDIVGEPLARHAGRAMKFDGHMLYPVTGISVENYDGCVYDIEMENDDELLNEGRCYYCNGTLSSNSYVEYGTVNMTGRHFLTGALNVIKMQNLGG